MIEIVIFMIDFLISESRKSTDSFTKISSVMGCYLISHLNGNMV